MSASVQTNPPSIKLSWPGDTNAVGYTISRRQRDEAAWGTAMGLAGDAEEYFDTNVVLGGNYEYRLKKTGDGYLGYGYVYAGILAPLVEERGRVILLVERSQARGMEVELARQEQDLVGDGWIVSRLEVDGTHSAAQVKAEVLMRCSAYPGEYKSLFIFGGVPVPYSGEIAPDGHGDHAGAWPADVFYGDLDGGWTDSTVNKASAADPRNRNVPGDGKFDASSLPSDVDLEVGRVDLGNLPAFGISERELLRRYLRKAHEFRFGRLAAERRGLVDDKFGVNNGEAFAVNGWRNFSAMFGTTGVAPANWSTLTTQSFLWAYGCGPGTYTSAGGVTTTASLAATDPKAVFTMLFGSYFGDWDSRDNLMRAALATPSYTLSCVWAGRPNFQFHHMALGETIGYSTRRSQNNSTGYSPGGNWRYVHIALMGDPTLRMHPVGPARELAVKTNGTGGVDLNWQASRDSVLGYHVYRAATSTGPFTRLTKNLLTGTSYTVPEVTTDDYMVRAVKLEVSASGSYYNASQGIFQSVGGHAGAPWVALYEPANNSVFGLKSSIQVSASLFDPANAVTNVSFFAGGMKIGETVGPDYAMVWTNAPGGNHLVMARAWSSIGQHTNSEPVLVRVDHGGTPRLSINPVEGGAKLISGEDWSNRVYGLQFSPALLSSEWREIGSVTGQPSGIFQFVDTNMAPMGIYRTVRQ